MSGSLPAELDLDAAEPPGPPAPRRSPSRFAWAAAGLAVGLLAGHAWLPADLPEAVQVPPPAAAAAPVRLALGGYQMWTEGVPKRIGSRLVVQVPAVVVNTSTAPVFVRTVSADGPGAAVYGDDGCAPYTSLPFVVPPGEERDLPFCLLSDCQVAVRPVPRIVVTVGALARGGGTTAVDAPIPDLARLWGASLTGCDTGS